MFTVRSTDPAYNSPLIGNGEVVYPVAKGIFVHCAAVRALENAARAAELLTIDAARRETWRGLAAAQRQTLPVDETGKRYRYADDGIVQPGCAARADGVPVLVRRAR
jgi:hypothetical protein